MSAVPSSSVELRGQVIVCAGRRVDAPDASVARFPQQNVPRVQAEVEGFLRQSRPTAIVSSAACGADLLVLQSALNEDLPCHVLLPSSPDEFRDSSVTDRPGDWGPIYDTILQTAQIELLRLPSGQEAYLEVNRKLLDKAQSIAEQQGTSVASLVIWNKESRGEDDVTAHFLREARRRGFPVSEISTL